MRLTTDRLDLVALDVERDLPELHPMFADPVWAAAGLSDPVADPGESRARLDREFGDNGGLTWVLRLRPSDRAIGVVGVFSDQGTPIRGLSWYLRRDHWGQGLMSEAALTVVDHLLGLPSIDGVEAWIDSRNSRSIGVARRARLAQVGRLPRVQGEETSQWLVMARAATPADPVVLGVRPVLPVTDIPRALEVLVGLLGMQLRFQYGEPEPEFARVAPTPWNGGGGLDLRRTSDVIVPTSLTLDVGVQVDPLHQAVLDAGYTVVTPPTDLPWPGREFSFRLDDGHVLTISGPSLPDRP